MVWEYLILGAIVGWAVFYLWRTFFRKGGCACGSCPSAKSRGCPTQGSADLCTMAGTADADAGGDVPPHPPPYPPPRPGAGPSSQYRNES